MSFSDLSESRVRSDGAKCFWILGGLKPRSRIERAEDGGPDITTKQRML